MLRAACLVERWTVVRVSLGAGKLGFGLMIGGVREIQETERVKFRV